MVQETKTMPPSNCCFCNSSCALCMAKALNVKVGGPIGVSCRILSKFAVWISPSYTTYMKHAIFLRMANIAAKGGAVFVLPSGEVHFDAFCDADGEMPNLQMFLGQ